MYARHKSVGRLLCYARALSGARLPRPPRAYAYVHLCACVGACVRGCVRPGVRGWVDAPSTVSNSSAWHGSLRTQTPLRIYGGLVKDIPPVKHCTVHCAWFGGLKDV